MQMRLVAPLLAGYHRYGRPDETRLAITVGRKIGALPLLRLDIETFAAHRAGSGLVAADIIDPAAPCVASFVHERDIEKPAIAGMNGLDPEAIKVPRGIRGHLQAHGRIP